jgi:HAD superfamily hydrolase (TIGR01549 family)
MAIIFDLDGTLIDSIPLHEKTFKYGIDKVLGKNAVPMSFLKKMVRYPTPMILGRAAKKFHLKIDKKTYSKILVAKREALSSKKISKIKTFDDAVNLMKFLKRNKIKFCIATGLNTEELKRFTRILKLKRFLCPIINPDCQAHEKPNPYILNKSIRILRVNKRDAVYIGDSPYDFLAAKRAGIKFIGVFNKKELEKHGNFYNTFSDVAKKIRNNLTLFGD